MTRTTPSARSPRSRPPLDARRLEEMALRYVGRFATSRAKLRAYLARKIRELGWGGEGQADLDAMTQRFAELGYVDDRAYAMAKAQSLTGRGYGKRRVEDGLRLAGIDEPDGAEARSHADAHALDAALHFARRRKLGPFAAGQADPRQREKAIAAMARAGHSFALSRAIAELSPGAEIDRDQLAERGRLGGG
jgi:regulatory protein